MQIAISDFKGEAPKRNARMLPGNFGQQASNTRLEDGSLGPVFAPVVEEVVGDSVQSIYRNADGSWRFWNTPGIKAVAAPIAADRLYLTGLGAPKVIDGVDEYNLALPRPVGAPVATQLSGTLDTDVSENIRYAYTYLTSLGEESAPSPLSNPIDWSDGVVIRLTGLSTPPAGRAITDIRIYRSVTSSTGATDLYYVDEIAVAASYDHDLDLAPIQEPCPTTHFSTPVNTLSGLIALPNGIMAAFSDRTLYFSEPYQPHAWPASYSLDVDYPIVGLAAFGSYVAILTEGVPYRAQGLHPESMAIEKIEEDLPCVSAAGIVDLGYSAIYPSTEGLVMLSPSSTQVITRPILSLEQWNAMQPASIVAARHNGRYWFSMDGTLNGRTGQAALLDLTGEQPFLIGANAHAVAAVSGIRDGRTFFIDLGEDIMEWDPLSGSTRATQKWRSKLFALPTPNSFGAYLVEGEESGEGTVFSMRVYAEGALIFETAQWPNNEPRRLPSSGLKRRWEIEVETNATITAITIAGSMDELAAP